MRGRNNRKGPNPLTRTYESNGPDVKIRGSAQQVAEKYAALARDAQSSGDRVMAENYLQHAEHYNRIIAAAQAQVAVQHQRDTREDFDEDYDEEREEFDSAPASAPAPQTGNNGSGPQPVIEGVPAEVALGEDNAVSDDKQQETAEMNGHSVEGDANDGQSQRRRRPRRGRSRAGAEAASDDSQPAEAPQPDNGGDTELANAS